MKLSEFKHKLQQAESLNFILPDGHSVPVHFHITEAGLVTRNFMDCGGETRTEKTAIFQIWTAEDTQHRLDPAKLLKIIHIAGDILTEDDLTVEFEYQSDTIGKYGVGFDGENFLLIPSQTDCRAKESCGIPEPAAAESDQSLQQLSVVNSRQETSCTPGGGCC